MTEHTEQVQNYFLSAVLLISFVLIFLLFEPYLTAVLLAFVMAVIFYPIFTWLLKYTGNRNGWTAAIITLLVIFVVVVPIAFFLDLVIGQITITLSHNQQLVNISTIHLPTWATRLNIDLNTYLQDFFNNIFGNIGNLFSNILQTFVFLSLTIFSLFYFFKDGTRMKEWILDALPFTNKQAEKLSGDLTSGIRAVIGGYLLVAILQGTVSGFGFWTFGVPNPALWGFVAVIAALVPTVGTSFVNIPAIIYLFATNNIGHGIGMTIWYIIAVTFIDNFIGPKFISGRVKIHILLLILSIIGGIRMFGALGFIIGPVILIFFWSVLQMFREKEVLPIKNIDS